jgi:hypothetical protein
MDLELELIRFIFVFNKAVNNIEDFPPKVPIKFQMM